MPSNAAIPTVSEIRRIMIIFTSISQYVRSGTGSRACSFQCYIPQFKHMKLSSGLVPGSVTSRISHRCVNHSAPIKDTCHPGHSVTHLAPTKQTCHPARSGTDLASRRTEEARFRSQAIPCGIFGGQIGTETGLSPSAIFIHSSTTLYINLAKDIPLSPMKQKY